MALSEKTKALVSEVVENTGWTRKEAFAAMKDAKRRLGITYNQYCKHRFYNTPVEAQEKRLAFVRERAAKKKVAAQKRYEIFLEKLLQVTGWTREEAVEKFDECRARTKCTMEEYYFYHYYELPEDVQNEIFNANKSNLISRRYNADRDSVAITLNKGLTNAVFNDYLNRKWCVNNEIEKDEFVELFEGSARILYKPIDGHRGFGVETFDVNPDNLAETYDKLAAFPAGLVEEYVVQHPVLSSLCPSSVNTIRIVSISSSRKPVTADGKHMDLAYAALRIGGGDSVVDNFHSGGMVAAVDLETGVILTDAVDEEGRFFERHPKTGTVFKGLQLPRFDEAIALVREAQEMSGIEGYIGWDIAISEKGPALIEINHQPGAMLLTSPYIAQKKGMMPVMRKYLW